MRDGDRDIELGVDCVAGSAASLRCHIDDVHVVCQSGLAAMTKIDHARCQTGVMTAVSTTLCVTDATLSISLGSIQGVHDEERYRSPARGANGSIGLLKDSVQRALQVACLRRTLSPSCDYPRPVDPTAGRYYASRIMLPPVYPSHPFMKCSDAATFPSNLSRHQLPLPATFLLAS